MKNIKNILFYTGTIGLFSTLIYWFIQKGKLLESGREIIVTESRDSTWTQFIKSMSENLGHPLALLLSQIVTIILVARIFGWLCKKIGQPSVIGEIAAGIVMGPSLVGIYFPEFSAALFPATSLGNLQFLSQIGLILFMFMVGMELELKTIRNKAQEAVVISHSSIITPFTLGIILAYYIYDRFAPSNVEFLSFALFLGIAMSITAFPVLARIVQERGLHKTKLGTVVITCAAVDDITAWSILAAVIAIVKAGSFVSSLYTIALAFGYVLLMLKVVKPFLKRVGELHPSRETLTKPVVAIFLLTLMLSSYATEVIGIHALFGAFMAGAIMPESMKFRNIFIEKVEDVALVLLLPLFFVFTGLRTQIGLLNELYLWEVTGMIILVAVAGKFLGSSLAAKYVGMKWRDSLIIGALMNARGLVELVVLNIGYDLGVLSPQIFAMMVIMALVTTFMTGPVINIIEWFYRKEKEDLPTIARLNNKYKVLFSFGKPERGISLLRLAHSFTKRQNGNAIITALHLSPTNELSRLNVDEYEYESFAPVIEESRMMRQKLTTFFKESNDIVSDIANVANTGHYDLLLVGIGQSVYEGSLLGKVLGFTTRIINPDRLLNKVVGKEKMFEDTPFDEKTRNILSKCDVPVGILIDKSLGSVDQVFIPIHLSADALLLPYIEKLLDNSEARVTLWDKHNILKNNSDFNKLVERESNPIQMIFDNNIGPEFLQQHDLMMISLNSWKHFVDTEAAWLKQGPSTLIISDNRLN